MKRLGKVNKTVRGFERIDFEDHYKAKCSVQQSSLTTPALWIGPNEAAPMVMASRAEEVGVSTAETCGWVPYPVPDIVSMNTRMHLDRKQVAALINHLQAWLDTGSLKVK